MTVKQLLLWCLDAYNKHDDSYNDCLDKYNLCKKQALLNTQPKTSTHGYNASEGELEVAISLMFGNTYHELAEWEDAIWEAPMDPASVPDAPADLNRIIPQNAYAAPLRESPITETIFSNFGNNPAPITMAEVRERIEEHNHQILSETISDAQRALADDLLTDAQRAEADDLLSDLENEIGSNPPSIMSTAEMGRHMAEVLSRPVPPECVIPMDLRISTES